MRERFNNWLDIYDNTRFGRWMVKRINLFTWPGAMVASIGLAQAPFVLFAQVMGLTLPQAIIGYLVLILACAVSWYVWNIYARYRELNQLEQAYEGWIEALTCADDALAMLDGYKTAHRSVIADKDEEIELLHKLMERKMQAEQALQDAQAHLPGGRPTGKLSSYDLVELKRTGKIPREIETLPQLKTTQVYRDAMSADEHGGLKAWCIANNQTYTTWRRWLSDTTNQPTVNSTATNSNPPINGAT